jgi:hypothetical protein
MTNFKVELTPAELLRQLRAQKVNLYVDGGKLRYQAPVGAVTMSQMFALKQHREAIANLIERTCADCGCRLEQVCCELEDGRRMCSDCMVGR